MNQATAPSPTRYYHIVANPGIPAAQVLVISSPGDIIHDFGAAITLTNASPTGQLDMAQRAACYGIELVNSQ